MTNGEKLKEVFPNMRIDVFESYVQVVGENYEFNNLYPLKWWNAEYKEPTTKENSGVDAVSRVEVLKLMQDNWHTHNGDWAMQESMDDIRALPSVTPQELYKDCISRQDLINWLKHWTFGDASPLIDFVNSMPSVTPQEPILDQITEIIEPLRHLPIGEMSDIEWDILRVIDKYKAEVRDNNG